MINTVDIVAELLTEIGPDLGALAILQLQEGQWAIVYDEQTVIDIDYQPDRHCLGLLIDIGSPRPEHQLESFRRALVYSSLNDQMEGLRVALDAPDGGLVLLLDLFTEDLDRVTLESALVDFVDVARAWRIVIKNDVDGDGDGVGPEARNAGPGLELDACMAARRAHWRGVEVEPLAAPKRQPH